MLISHIANAWSRGLLTPVSELPKLETFQLFPFHLFLISLQEFSICPRKAEEKERSMIRTPPAKPRQTRAHVAQQSADTSSLHPCTSFEERTERVDDSRSAVSSVACGINGKNSKFEGGEPTGESVSPSSPLVTLESKSVGRLDTNVFKLFVVANLSILLSSSSSDTSASDNADESAICQGGPGKFNCGV